MTPCGSGLCPPDYRGMEWHRVEVVSVRQITEEWNDTVWKCLCPPDYRGMEWHRVEVACVRQITEEWNDTVWKWSMPARLQRNGMTPCGSGLCPPDYRGMEWRRVEVVCVRQITEEWNDAVWKWYVSARLQRNVMTPCGSGLCPPDYRETSRLEVQSLTENTALQLTSSINTEAAYFSRTSKTELCSDCQTAKTRHQKLTYQWYKWKQNTRCHLPVLRQNVHFHLKSGWNLAPSHWIP
jgi:hypothetical protein